MTDPPASSIPTADFARAMLASHERWGYTSALTVAEILGAPPDDVCAKIAELDEARIIEGCDCWCSSPMWLVDGQFPHSGLNVLVDMDDKDTVARLIAPLLETP